jgi:glycosyltransferase involved in cell wall biosynthesis
MDQTISIILPALDDAEIFEQQIQAILSQSRPPNEIIVVDSSSSDQVESLAQKFNHDITYFRAGRATRFDRYLKLVLDYIPWTKKFIDLKNYRAYPAESANFGAERASGNILALLDMATIPESNWLQSSLEELNSGYCIVFGRTRYLSSTLLQKLIHYSTFGVSPIESNPGTLIFKESYLEYKMLEGFRAGADLEWRQRIKAHLRWRTTSKTVLNYRALPKSFLRFLEKMFIYQMHSAPLKIQMNSKDAAAFLFFIAFALLAARWNYLVGWESQLYAPHVTKLFFLIVNIFFIQLIIIRRFGYKFFNRFLPSTLNYYFILTMIVSLFFLSYRWNALAADWLESSAFYVPHVTKIFIGMSMLLLIGYRGLYFPIRSGISIQEILPFRFILIGIVGALGDIAKLPGLMLGSIFSVFLVFSKKNEA